MGWTYQLDSIYGPSDAKIMLSVLSLVTSWGFRSCWRFQAKNIILIRMPILIALKGEPSE
jgi:hypothetical protein